jgi:hypothetical protein
MGWISKIFRSVSKEEMKGLHLNMEESYWEVEGPDDFEETLNALIGWVPKDSILYFEDGSPDNEISAFMNKNSVPEVSHIAMGKIWPRPKVYHLPAKEHILRELAAIMQHHATPELAIHFHIYIKGKVLIEWHDAFSQPMLMNGSISEEKVKAFAGKIGKEYKKIIEQACAREASSSRP